MKPSVPRGCPWPIRKLVLASLVMVWGPLALLKAGGGGAERSSRLFAAPAGGPLTIVALGDSTTAGSPGYSSPAQSPPEGRGNPESQYAFWMMKDHREWRVFNRGVAGERSDQILARLESDVIGLKPDMAIVLAGVNDLYRGYSAEHVQTNLRTIYERLRQSNIPVMACTVLPFNGMRPVVEEEMRVLNRWIHSYSMRHSMPFCDTFRVLEDPMRPGNLASTTDGLHPDVAGYRKMGEAVAHVLEEWLARGNGEESSV